MERQARVEGGRQEAIAASHMRGSGGLYQGSGGREGGMSRIVELT